MNQYRPPVLFFLVFILLTGLIATLAMMAEAVGHEIWTQD